MMNAKRAVMAALVAAALAVAASPAAAAEQNPPLDAWLTTKAKLGVLTNVGTAGTNVNVDTVRGVVTLHGTVASEADKTKAEEAAKKIEGVSEVRNLLKVVPSKDADAMAANDDKIKEAVVAALKKASSLANSSISVQSVNDGTVLLAGKAENSLAHLKAVEVARSVSGVDTVASEIESPDVQADAEIWRQIEGAGEPPAVLDTADRAAHEKSTTEKMTDGAKRAGETVAEKTEAGASRVKETAKSAGDAVASGMKTAGSKTKGAFQGLTGSAKDAAITSAVKAKLLADDETPGTAINVDTENGVVTLFGTVPSDKAKKKAEKEARNVTGVKSVKNQLRIESVRGARTEG
jgi:hyperosmotically inducible protein